MLIHLHLLFSIQKHKIIIVNIYAEKVTTEDLQISTHCYNKKETLPFFVRCGVNPFNLT